MDEFNYLLNNTIPTEKNEIDEYFDITNDDINIKKRNRNCNYSKCLEPEHTRCDSCLIGYCRYHSHPYLIYFPTGSRACINCAKDIDSNVVAKAIKTIVIFEESELNEMIANI